MGKTFHGFNGKDTNKAALDAIKMNYFKKQIEA